MSHLKQFRSFSVILTKYATYVSYYLYNSYFKTYKKKFIKYLYI